MPDYEASTWRDLLRGIIRDQDERMRIARAVGVNPETLRRWSISETSPHWNETRALLSAVPALIPTLLRDLLGTSAPELSSARPQSPQSGVEPSSMNTDKETEDIAVPWRLYDDVLQATSEKTARFLAVCNLVIPHVISQLDPHRLGIQIAVVRCIPPLYGDEKVRSLHKCMAQGTPPWKNEYLQEQYQFLGREALAGYVVMRRHWFMIPNAAAQSHLFITHAIHEASVTAYPIMREGNVAGCLIASSTQLDYFTHTRLNLMRAYTHLIGLAFADTDFFPHDRIELGVMPCWDRQKPYFNSFRKMVNEIQRKSREGQTISTDEAENQVRKMIEGELLALQSQQPGEVQPKQLEGE